MIPEMPGGNLASWLIQTVLIALVGASMPSLFRIRHPRSRLAYCHVVLILCLALPLIQPWQNAIIIGTVAEAGSAAFSNTSINWTVFTLLILAAGVIARLCWLSAGLWQLRRYRQAAVPLAVIPDSVREAKRLTGAYARFCISSSVQGPATMGWSDPVVLLPPGFLDFDYETQCGIACHELLHVRRRDWLVTIGEELIGSLFWFNPGTWWLLAQAKLSREQVVDAGAVRLTSREPYVKALLSLAVVSRRQRTVPATSFFTRGHLVGRMRSLLAEAKLSVMRLSFSYGLIAFLLLATLWSVFTWLPMQGDARVVLAYAPVQVMPRPVLEIAPAAGVRQFLFRVAGPDEQDKVFVRVPVPPDLKPEGDILLLRPLFSSPMLDPVAAGGVAPQQEGGIAGSAVIVRPKQPRLPIGAGGGNDQSVVWIHRSEDGTRMTIQARRLRHEADSDRSSIPSTSAEPAPTDRID